MLTWRSVKLKSVFTDVKTEIRARDFPKVIQTAEKVKS
jgi:hypothetical protein